MQNKELQRCQKELKTVHRQYLDLFESAPVGYFILDLGGQILEVNLRGAEILGLDRQDLIQKFFFHFATLKDRPLLINCLDELGRTGAPQRCDLRMRRGQAPFYAHLEGTSVKDFPGQAPHFLIAVLDISGTKQAAMERERLISQLGAERERVEELAAQARRRAEEFLGEKLIFKALMDNVPAGITIVEAKDLRIQAMSRYGRALTGLPDNQLIGVKLDHRAAFLFHPDGTPAKPEEIPLYRAVREAESVIDEEWILQRPSGERFTVLCNASPIRDGAGKIVSGVVVWSDITTLKIAQEKISAQAEELRRSRDELEERVRERTAELVKAHETVRDSENRLRHLSAELLKAQEKEREKIAMDLHDSFAASLAAIKFQLERKIMQEEECPPVEGKAGVVRLTDMVTMVQNNIDDLRRIMTNLRPSVLDDLGILATIKWFCREFEKTYADIRVERRVDIGEDDVPDFLKTVIFRVLQEASNNVARHSGADRLDIAFAKEGDTIRLCIQDNGRGFDVLETLKNKRGLGLSFMRERVDISGGKFAIQSTPGKGTVIRAEWPAWSFPL